MEYQPLRPARDENLTSKHAGPAETGPEPFRRAHTPFGRRLSTDEIPLLDMSSFSEVDTKRQNSSHTKVRAHRLSDNIEPSFKDGRHYMNLESSDKPGLAYSIREYAKSAYNYIRASGPAKPSRSVKPNAGDGRRRMPTGWRLGTWVCCSGVALCIILEIALLIYATKTNNKGESSDILRQGSCQEVRSLELWLLFPLNIAGTILIGASNYVMQVMSASERKDIDFAHASARSVNVAGLRFSDLVLSKRSKMRRTIWWTLGLSSVPIHFLLNVAVYSSIQASNPGILVVSDDFNNDTSWTYCDRLPSGPNTAEAVACSLHHNYTQNHTKHMTTLQCLQQYSSGFQTNASSVIVVTSSNSPRWYNPPLTVEVPSSISYGLPCREVHKNCSTSSYSCDKEYTVISDRNIDFTYNKSISSTIVSFDFLPFCNNQTILKSNGSYDHWEIQTTGESNDNWNYTIQDDLFFRKNDSLSDITSIKALFSAFQYPYWATAAITDDYLNKDYSRLLDNRDPRSWLCPRGSLADGQPCDPLALQKMDTWSITPASMLVEECYVLHKDELCTLHYSSSILIITICFDLIKLSAMIVALNFSFKPLMTLGDVIESFLVDPDPYTEHRGIVDDDQALYWINKVGTEIRTKGFAYARDHFGFNFQTQLACPYCGRRLITRPAKTGIHLSVMADHLNCGRQAVVNSDSSDFGEQAFTWSCKGGLWWTTVKTPIAQSKSTSLRGRRWMEVPSKKRWKWLLYIYAPALGLATIYFAINFKGLLTRRLLNTWTIGFTAPDPNSLLTGGLAGATSIYTAAIAVNAPQFAFSMLYFMFNATLTMMHTAHEWASFAVHQKALRVSSPRGQQRATYWLQLPWAYSIPLIVACGTMHWLLSRSLYIVKIDFYGYLGEREIDKDYFACGFSPIPALLLVVILVSMCVAIVGLSFRRLPAGMPLVRLNSLAIAAACHADPHEQGLELKPLKWGVLDDCLKNGLPHCSFSAKDVTPPLVSSL